LPAQLKTPQQKRIYLLLIVVVVGNISDFLFRPLTGAGYPIFAFMTSPVGRFDDFYNNLYANNGLAYPTVQGFIFTPMSIWVYKLFSLIPNLLGLWIFFVIGLIGIAAVFKCFSFSWLLIFTLLVSYPVLFTLARGNNELWLFPAVGVTVLMVKKGRPRSSAVLFALTNLFEPYPLLILMWKNPLKLFRTTVGITVAVTLPIFIFFEPYDVWQYVKAYLGPVSGYTSGYNGLGVLHNHSLPAGLSVAKYLVTGRFVGAADDTWGLIFSIWLLAGVLIIGAILLIAQLNLVDRLVGIASASCLLPSMSFDYRLIYLLLPLGLLVMKDRLDLREKLQLILIVVLIIPKNYVWFRYDMDPVGSTLGSIVNPILLLVLLSTVFSVIYFQFRKVRILSLD